MCATSRFVQIVIFIVGFVCGTRADESCSGLRTLRKKGCSFEVILDIPNDGSGVYNFVLNASMQTYSNTNMDVELENEEAVRDGTADYLTYVVTHPTCSLYPRVTRLEFNGNVLCTNPPYDVSTGLPATQLYFFSTHYGQKRAPTHRRHQPSQSTTHYHAYDFDEDVNDKYAYSGPVSQLRRQQQHNHNHNAAIRSSIGDETCSGMRTLRKSYCSHDVVLTIPSDGSGTYNFKLNASMQIYSNENMNVVLENEAAVKDGSADFLTYVVTHPSCNKYPLVTRLEFNGKVICTNKQYDISGGEPATQLYFECLHFGQKRNKVPFNVDFNQATKDFSNTLMNGQKNFLENMQNWQNTLSTGNNFQNNPFLGSAAGNIFGNTASGTVNTPYQQQPSIPHQHQPSDSGRKPVFFIDIGDPSTFQSNPFSQGNNNNDTNNSGHNINNFPTPISPQYNDNPVATPKPPPRVPDSNELCGFSTRPLIRGGDNVFPGEFPWLGALFVLEGNRTNYICTVNLIGKRQVLTAAHCVFDNIKAPHIFRVVFGLTKEPELNYLFVQSIRVHPAYQKGNATHDAAFLTLTETESLSLPSPICVWQNYNELPGTGIVAGFGPDYTSFRKIRFPVVTQEECRGSHIHFHYVTSDFTFCAGTRDRQGPCLGDSGAGFMQWVSDRYYLRGLVSQSLSANNDCNLAEYVIFSDLSKETDWIQDMLT